MVGGPGRRDEWLATPAEGSQESPRFMWITGAVLFGVGATIGMLSLVVPHPESFDDSALWTTIAISYLGALLCIVAADRLPAWPTRLLALAGTVVVTAAAYYSGDPSGFYTFFYVWVGLYSIFFFPRRDAIVFLVLIGAAYAWVLAELDAPAPLAMWITTLGTVALAVFVVDQLVWRVRRMATESAAIARERAELMGKLEEVARTDELTGLPNRRAWDEELNRELARARRDGTPLCVGIIDLDRFKDYNDRHGHIAGDRLLKEMAASWQSQLRATDAISRYGGEEFTFALPGCDLDDGCELIERLRQASPSDQTCSAGLAIWDGEEDADTLLGRADKALYEAKAAGRDRIVSA